MSLRDNNIRAFLIRLTITKIFNFYFFLRSSGKLIMSEYNSSPSDAAHSLSVFSKTIPSFSEMRVPITVKSAPVSMDAMTHSLHRSSEQTFTSQEACRSSFWFHDRQCRLPRRYDPFRLLCDTLFQESRGCSSPYRACFCHRPSRGAPLNRIDPIPVLYMICHKSFRNRKKRLRSHRVHHNSVRCFIIGAPLVTSPHIPDSFRTTFQPHVPHERSDRRRTPYQQATGPRPASEGIAS